MNPTSEHQIIKPDHQYSITLPSLTNNQTSENSSTNNTCLLDRTNLESSKVVDQPIHLDEMINLDNFNNNQQPWLYFDEYFLRGNDESESSMLQDVIGQSYENQHHSDESVANLINSNHSDSLFKLDAEDHKPSAMELNYYSSQYLNNPSIFQHSHLNQSNPHFLHSINPFDYPHHLHHTMLNGHNSNCSTTYSNDSTNILPNAHHHHLTSFKSNEQLNNNQQTNHYASQQSSLHSNLSNLSTSSYNDLSNCDNNTILNANQQQITAQQHCQLVSMQLVSKHALFDTDVAYKTNAAYKTEKIEKNDDLFKNEILYKNKNEQQNKQIDQTDHTPKSIKEEKIDEFNIRNSLDLANSTDFLDYNSSEIELNLNDQQLPSLSNIQSSNSKELLNSNDSSMFYSNDTMNSAMNTLNHGFNHSLNNLNHIKPMNVAKSTLKSHLKLNGNLNGIGKRVISLEQAANVKLEKVKIERSNGMKIYYFKCSLCTYQTNTSQSMKDHLYCIHCKAKNNYKCNICHQTFGWKNNAQRHMRRKHKIEDQTTKREAIITLI